MKNKHLSIVIMAAGKGTRMSSEKPKVLHEIAGKTLLNHVISCSEKLNPVNIVIVVGYKADSVKESVLVKNIKFSLQKQQKGTGHAVLQTKNHLDDFSGQTLVLSGDVPFINSETLEQLIDKQVNNNLSATILTAEVENPEGYGRIIRDNNNNLLQIREHKDCSASELEINEINSGIYVFKNKLLFELLPKLENNNSQSEFYLPDVLNMIIKDEKEIGIHKIKDPFEIQGINTIKQLKDLEKRSNQRDI